jgi:hypothetical protein
METAIKNKSAYEAMMRGIERNSHGIDVSGYPEDTADTIVKVCELWNLRPPTMKKSKAYWIQSARELTEACGEFGVFVLEQVRADFVKVMEENIKKGIGGVAPYIVEGPNSLVKVARAKAGELRSKGGETNDERRRNQFKNSEYAWMYEHNDDD